MCNRQKRMKIDQNEKTIAKKPAFVTASRKNGRRSGETAPERMRRAVYFNKAVSMRGKKPLTVRVVYSS